MQLEMGIVGQNLLKEYQHLQSVFEEDQHNELRSKRGCAAVAATQLAKLAAIFARARMLFLSCGVGLPDLPHEYQPGTAQRTLKIENDANTIPLPTEEDQLLELVYSAEEEADLDEYLFSDNF